MVKPTRLPKPSLADPVQLLAFGFGAGCAPRAPGTFGTLAGIALYLPLAQLSLPAYAAILLCAAVFGVWLCGTASRRLAVHDHPGIVWDEIVGYLVTMFGLPFGLAWVVAGFVLFRLFDIWKPWPISWLDRRVSGGLGIMVDDVAAGAAACVCLHAAHALAG
jgi:phosphatidylglycerophosphatase A